MTVDRIPCFEHEVTNNLSLFFLCFFQVVCVICISYFKKRGGPYPDLKAFVWPFDLSHECKVQVLNVIGGLNAKHRKQDG